MQGFAKVVVKESPDGEFLFSIQGKENLMYFVHLALAISSGVLLAKAVRAYTA